MKLITKIQPLRREAEAVRERGESLGFVPTMGALHRGHLSLIERARRECQRVAISIFVNRIQFGPGEDFESYPRRIEEDLKAAEGAGVDLVFVPEEAELYPPGFSSWVTVEGLSTKLCGRFRPGHFRGVATVVLKLLNILLPHRAYFGEKDYQQLIIIKRLVRDLDLPLEIVGCPTVRDADGLALSSRNSYLSPSEREKATALFRALREAEALPLMGERGAQAVKERALEVLSGAGLEPEYLALVDLESLEEVGEVEGEARLLLACRVGQTRLIDNILLRLGRKP